VDVELEPLEPPPVLRRLRAGELDIAVVRAVPGEPDRTQSGIAHRDVCISRLPAAPGGAEIVSTAGAASCGRGTAPQPPMAACRPRRRCRTAVVPPSASSAATNRPPSAQAIPSSSAAGCRIWVIGTVEGSIVRRPSAASRLSGERDGSERAGEYVAA
jgi:hypothetical protein